MCFRNNEINVKLKFYNYMSFNFCDDENSRSMKYQYYFQNLCKAANKNDLFASAAREGEKKGSL